LNTPLHTGVLRLRDAAEGRAPTTGLVAPKHVETTRSERRDVTLLNGIRVVVEPVSDFSYSTSDSTSDTTRDANAGGTGALDGDATITVPPSAESFSVETHDGTVTLLPGRFHIHAPRGHKPIEVKADSGTAVFHGRAITPHQMPEITRP